MNQFKTLLVCLILLTSFSAGVYAATYQYDANGNMIRDGEKGQCYLYNQANQLKEVNNCSGGKIAQYWYDYTGRRIKTVEYNSTGGNITTYYPFPDAEIVMNGTQMLNTTYYFANGERVARQDPDGSMHYYSGDHLGSTAIVTDENGSIEEKTRYLPYGETLSHTGKNTTKHLYTGQEKDTETGLYYYLSRYYNPQLPRFIQPDTYIANLYNPQDLNPYSYVLNNPLKYNDPTGHQANIDINLGIDLATLITGSAAVGCEVVLGAEVMVLFGVFVTAKVAQDTYHVAKSYYTVSFDGRTNYFRLHNLYFKGPVDPKKTPDKKQPDSEEDDWGPTNYELKEGDQKVDTMNKASDIAREKSGMPNNQMEPDPSEKYNVFYDAQGKAHYRSWVGKKGTPYEGSQYRLDGMDDGNGPNYQHFSYRNSQTGEEGHIFFKSADESAFFDNL